MSTSPVPRVPHPSRRSLLAAGGALGAGVLLTACGDDSGGSSGNGGNGGAGSFRFTDDRGETVALAGRPERIVAFIGSAAVLADYGLACAGVFGPTRGEGGEPDAQAGEVDLDGVTVLGQEWGE